MSENYNDYDWLIATFKKQKEELVKDKLTELINYCRYQQKLYNEFKDKKSGSDVLIDLVKDGYMKQSLMIQLLPLIEDLKLSYTLLIENTNGD